MDRSALDIQVIPDEEQVEHGLGRPQTPQDIGVQESISPEAQGLPKPCRKDPDRIRQTERSVRLEEANHKLDGPSVARGVL